MRGSGARNCAPSCARSSDPRPRPAPRKRAQPPRPIGENRGRSAPRPPASGRGAFARPPTTDGPDAVRPACRSPGRTKRRVRRQRRASRAVSRDGPVAEPPRPVLRHRWERVGAGRSARGQNGRCGPDEASRPKNTRPISSSRAVDPPLVVVGRGQGARPRDMQDRRLRSAPPPSVPTRGGRAGAGDRALPGPGHRSSRRGALRLDEER
jgi:hypothetical protein